MLTSVIKHAIIHGQKQEDEDVSELFFSCEGTKGIKRVKKEVHATKFSISSYKGSKRYS